MSFNLVAPTIRFGAGSVSGLPDDVAARGARPFVVTGGNAERVAHLTAGLDVAGSFALAGEPTFDDARVAVADAVASGADVVVGIGGGAVLDLAKAVAILAVAGGDPLDYAEVIGAGRKLPSGGLPWVAVPTTSGTGAEVTANAVLASPEHKVKVSLRSTAMLASLAIVDPELTLSCPRSVTAASGMDAVTQCLEPLTSRFANPLVDPLAVAGLRRAATSLFTLMDDGEDLEARTDMAFCSLMGGLSLVNAKLGAVHGFAGVLGGVTGAPHGDICGALLRPVTSANLAALQEREPGNPALEAYSVAAEALTGERSHEALDRWLAEAEQRLGLPRLGQLGLRSDEHDQVVEASMKASSMKGNPIDLTADELRAVLEAAA